MGYSIAVNIGLLTKAKRRNSQHFAFVASVVFNYRSVFVDSFIDHFVDYFVDYFSFIDAVIAVSNCCCIGWNRVSRM